MKRMLSSNFQTRARSTTFVCSCLERVCPFVDVGQSGSVFKPSISVVPFPEGYGATVHFHWPEKGFQLLGM